MKRNDRAKLKDLKQGDRFYKLSDTTKTPMTFDKSAGGKFLAQENGKKFPTSMSGNTDVVFLRHEIIKSKVFIEDAD